MIIFYTESDIFILLLKLAFVACLIAMSFIDLEYLAIPNILFYISFVLALLNLLYRQDISLIFAGLIGFLIMFSLFILAKIIYKNIALGTGDIYLIAIIGLFLGMKEVLLTIYFAFVLGGIAGLILILLKLKTKNDAIAFVPFIAIASLPYLVY